MLVQIGSMDCFWILLLKYFYTIVAVCKTVLPPIRCKLEEASL